MKQTKPRKAMALRFAMVLWTLVRVALAILLVIWCVLHLKALDRYFDFKLPYVGRIPGMIMIAIGGGLVMWCAVILSGAGILDNRADKLFPLELKATGPFRYVRNPMSLGATILFTRRRALDALNCGFAVFGDFVSGSSFGRGVRGRTGAREAIWRELFELQVGGGEMDAENWEIEVRRVKPGEERFFAGAGALDG